MNKIAQMCPFSEEATALFIALGQISFTSIVYVKSVVSDGASSLIIVSPHCIALVHHFPSGAIILGSRIFSAEISHDSWIILGYLCVLRLHIQCFLPLRFGALFLLFFDLGGTQVISIPLAALVGIG